MASRSKTPDMPPHRMLLNGPIWKGLYKAFEADARSADFDALYTGMLSRCESFLRHHPFGGRVEAIDLCDTLIVRRTRPKVEACSTDLVDQFLAENGVAETIRRMVAWVTQQRVLLGIASDLARTDHWAEKDVDWALPPDRVSQPQSQAEQGQNTAMALQYIYELCARTALDDLEARAFLWKLIEFAEKPEVSGPIQGRSWLGTVSLPVGAIRDLMNQAGADPEWTYEQARKVSDRLATATKWLWRDAAAAGFGTDAAAIYGFVAFKLKNPLGGGGKRPPREEI
jgi:hypothetical protein